MFGVEIGMIFGAGIVILSNCCLHYHFAVNVAWLMMDLLYWYLLKRKRLSMIKFVLQFQKQHKIRQSTADAMKARKHRIMVKKLAHWILPFFNGTNQTLFGIQCFTFPLEITGNSWQVCVQPAEICISPHNHRRMAEAFFKHSSRQHVQPVKSRFAQLWRGASEMLTSLKSWNETSSMPLL
jgi:hypothetical protein